MEAEIIASTNIVQEVVWLKRFLHHLGNVTKANEPVTINCDNHATIAYRNDPNYQGKIKHIDIKYNYVKDIVSRDEVIL